jgi:hypothetical protein
MIDRLGAVMNSKSWRHAVLSALLAVSATSAAQSGPDVRLSPLSETILRIRPGELGELRFKAQGSIGAVAYQWCHTAGPDQYVVTLRNDADARCPDLSSLAYGVQILFAAGDYECAYTVQRDALSRSDLSIGFSSAPFSGSTVSPLEFRLGTVPLLDLHIETEPASLLPDGRAEGYARLVVDNASSAAVRYLRAGDCLFMAMPFRVDGEIDGGCGPSVGAGFCFNGSYGFALPDVPAQGTASCRVRLTSTEVYGGKLMLPIRLDDYWMTDAANGGHLLPARSEAMRFLELYTDVIFRGDFELPAVGFR